MQASKRLKFAGCFGVLGASLCSLCIELGISPKGLSFSPKPTVLSKYARRDAPGDIRLLSRLTMGAGPRLSLSCAPLAHAPRCVCRVCAYQGSMVMQARKRLKMLGCFSGCRGVLCASGASRCARLA